MFHFYWGVLYSLDPFNAYLWGSLDPLTPRESTRLLKSCTPLLLFSNVVYKFTCSCDSNLTYIGKSIRHLITRVREHLNVASQHENSAIKQHKLSGTVCSNVRQDLNSFEGLKQCKSDFRQNS